MSTGVRIRPATADDVPLIAHMHRLLTEDQLAQGWRGVWPAELDRVQYFSQRLQNSAVHLLVAQRDGVVAGYTDASILPAPRQGLRSRARARLRRLVAGVRQAPAEPAPRIGYSHNTYVRVEHRRFGIARMLLEASVAAVRADGATVVRAHVLPGNPGMTRLIQEIGFVPIQVEYEWHR